MPTQPMTGVLDHLRRAALLQDAADVPDGRLLEGYVARRDEAAFAALVRRHGPMVLGVCRRVLGNAHDAEDAFQAVFLVLARKAASVRPPEKLASWLHGVAYHAALKARAVNARQRAREKQVRVMPEPATVAGGLWHDLLPLLDRELSRLPDKYRLPVVLCDLQGKTRREAARELGWPEGTVAGRLAGGRALLGRRLLRHGLPASGGVLTAVLARRATAAAVPAPLVRYAVEAAGRAGVAGAGSASVVPVAEGVIRAMSLTRLNVAAAVCLALGTVAAVAVVSSRPGLTGTPAGLQVAVTSSGEPEDGRQDEKGGEKRPEDEVRWGEVVDGLQAGGGLPAGSGYCRVGDSVRLVVRVRNVSGGPLRVGYYTDFAADSLRVEGPRGQPARVLMPLEKLSKRRLTGLTLQKGEEVELGRPELAVAAVAPAGDVGVPTLVAAPGDYQISFAAVARRGADRNAGGAVSTGKVILHVKGADEPARAAGDLEGTWQAVSFEQDARPLPEKEVKEVKDIVVTFAGDRYRFTAGMRVQGANGGTFRVNPESGPRSFELIPGSGPFEGKAFRGIYRREGDTLTLCFAWPPIDRPTEFRSPPNSTVVLAVFKRQKP